MYCPNCGKPNSAEQRYCRSCGLQLEETVESLTRQLPGTDLNAHLLARRRAVERLIQIAGGTAISIVVGAVLLGIIYEIMIVEGEVIGGSLFLAFVIGVILVGLLAMYRDSLVKASGKRELPGGASRGSAITGMVSAESRADSAPSVTESTTELLKSASDTGTEIPR